MANNQFNSTRLFVREHMQSAEVGGFVSGNVAVFSLQSPLKNDGENEDACALIQLSHHSGLLVLSDGVGGHRGGQDASALAVETMSKISQLEIADVSNLREPVLDAIEHCNATLLSEGLGAATTLLVVEVQGNQVRPYYIGDSTILVTGQRGKLKFQSIAQSPTGYALEAGVMEEAEVREDENRHFVSNIIGATDLHMTVGSWLELAPRDTLVMCSDGLTDNVYIDTIIENVRVGPLVKSACKLQQQCKLKMDDETGHPDDLSFILFRLK
ncbi:MAG: protein phosphatase 2C domain-containing protein [Gammaproteobacteria bacterium]|nr:protein phosphatase 2C domain-containing protein [Gammaproteobacteria bacterium]